MSVRFLRADYDNPIHARDIVALLDEYAVEPSGGGRGLSEYARANVVRELARRPIAFSILAYFGEEPVGLANCMTVFSTFSCRDVVNVHDLVVSKNHRRRGIATGLLAEVESVARSVGACKLTLEVLENNTAARVAYERFGFRGYQLDPRFGAALFLEKSCGS